MNALLEQGLALKVADAVWIATALLHREQPEAEGFTVAEVMEKVRTEGLTDRDDSSIYLHANQHCVANRPPNQAKLRMLFETREGLRRLSCASDAFHPARDGRYVPNNSDIPASFKPLLAWHQRWCSERRGREIVNDPLLALAGAGKGMWSRDAVNHVAKLRQDDEEQ